MLYDLCTYLYLEALGCLFPDEVYAYPVGDDEMTVFRRSRSCPHLPREKIPEEVLNGEEEIVWKQPTFVSSDEEDTADSFDDFIEIEGF